MRYFFHISYHGQFFNGWQRHPKAKSVQEVIENTLAQVFKTPTPIIGCGRTDTHVHASQFFFHAEIAEAFEYDLVFRLNKLLPYNIAVFDVVPVGDKQHARFDAVQRKYDYLIHTHKDPYLSHLSSLYELELNTHLMQKAVAILPKYQDYMAFCTSPDKYEHTICHVTEARLFATAKGDRIRFQISSNRYLTRMIRIIMGKLLKIGSGELSIAEFESYLAEKRTPALLDPAHPTGLYLSKVTYPYLDLAPRANLIIEAGDWIEVK